MWPTFVPLAGPLLAHFGTIQCPLFAPYWTTGFEKLHAFAIRFLALKTHAFFLQKCMRPDRQKRMRLSPFSHDEEPTAPAGRAPNSRCTASIDHRIGCASARPLARAWSVLARGNPPLTRPVSPWTPFRCPPDRKKRQPMATVFSCPEGDFTSPTFALFACVSAPPFSPSVYAPISPLKSSENELVTTRNLQLL